MREAWGIHLQAILDESGPTGALRGNEITMACMRQKGWHPASSSYTPQEKFTPIKVDLPS